MKMNKELNYFGESSLKKSDDKKHLFDDNNSFKGVVVILSDEIKGRDYD